MLRFSPRTALAALLLLAAGPAGLAAQGVAEPPPDLLDRLTFRSIGPATMGGRIDDLAVLETSPRVFYLGAATGGVWKTLNNGTTWEPVFDDQDVASIGALAIAPDDPDVVWVGTGEANNRQSSSWGAGVFKSTDGGRSWTSTGLVESRHVGRIVVDPTDHDVVYVAALGHLWGPNPERGVYKTTDGGETWSRVLFTDDDTGATDLVMDPSDPTVLYAAMYQRRRSIWGFNGGGPGSGLYRSADAGATWQRLEEGLPAGPLGRIAVDVFRSDPRVVYALVEAEEGSGIYRSDDGGGHWTLQSRQNPRPSYFSQVRVDPDDASRVYVLGVRLMISDDAGRTFEAVRVPETGPNGGRPRDDLDVHAMWIDPGDPAHLVIGSDVGLAISWDRGETWDYVNNLPLGQFYHVGYDMDTPYRVYGGLQDNDVWGGPSQALDPFGIGNRDWFTLVIGDGFVALGDSADSRLVYGETQGGNVSRVDRETGESLSIRPRPGPGEAPLRWAWDTPFLISPHDPNTLLTAAQRVFRSTDRGSSWQAVSPDLTGGADRDALSLMGTKGSDVTLSKNDGVSAWPTVVSLAESPLRAGLYYAGTDDGRVQVSSDGGGSWTDLTGRFPGLPAGAVPEELVASGFAEGTVYATFDNHAGDDYEPWVYGSADLGETWTSLAGTLPAGQVVNCITEDPRNRDVLYLGTESGLFVSLDRGGHWLPLRNNLPTVPVDEITIQPRDNDMLLATHGRSIWILNDLTPIQEAAEAGRARAHLFSIDPATEMLVKNDFAGYPGDRAFWGRNAPPGASIAWYLATGAETVALSVRDARGDLVREMASDDLAGGTAPGLHETSWDLRHEPVRLAGGGRGGPGGAGRGGRATPGPLVLPGDYRVTLTVDGVEAGSRTVHVSADPRLRIAPTDLVVLHDAAFGLHRLQGVMAEAATAVEAARAQTQAARAVLDSADAPPRELVARADSLIERLQELGQQVGVRAGGRGGGGLGGRGFGGGGETLQARVASLQRELTSWTEAPTAARLRAADESRSELRDLVAEINEAVTNEIPGLYEALGSAGLSVPPRQPIPPVEMGQGAQNSST